MLTKKAVITLGALILAIVCIPTLLVFTAFEEPAKEQNHKQMIEEQKESSSIQAPSHSLDEGPLIRIYLVKEKRMIELPLEHYIRNVVASEMPSDFHKEALKAQALAARTYIVDRLEKGSFSDMEKYGGAHVTDTVMHQAFQTDQQLRKKWGKQYQQKMEKVEEAVLSTAGKILTYRGKPIYAAYFSTSNGRTENSEDYFANSYPYLKSVDSSWDQQSPKFKQTTTLSLKEMVNKLEKKTNKKVAVETIATQKMAVKRRTEGDRIDSIMIGDQMFSGREVRESLGLASTDFSWEIMGDRITFQTYGYGHGVGMSQWGAHLLAQSGKTHEEIIKHYYQGVSIETYQKGES